MKMSDVRWVELVRVVLGLFLFVHFAHLLPWAAELFSNQGMLADGHASPLLRAFNPLAFVDSPLMIRGLVLVAMAASVALIFGKGERAAAIFLWLVLAWLFGRNPLIRNPSLPYVALLLLAHACRSALKRPGANDVTVRVVWMLLSLGYLYSGLTKLIAPSWLDGSAVEFILRNPLARPSVLRDALLGSPLLPLLTYGTLVLEIAFPFAALSRRLRPFVWLAMTALHLALLVLIDFADLTFGMLLVHLYVFDPAWLRRDRKGADQRSRGAMKSHRKWAPG